MPAAKRKRAKAPARKKSRTRAGTMALPPVVSLPRWKKAHARVLAKEKAASKARDRLAAERRRQPMTLVEKAYVFEGPQGDVTLLDLFDGRPQLALYHFMFAPGVHGWPDAGCPGCSMVLDNVGQFARVHMNQRGLSFAVVSRAPLANIERYRKRMGWTPTWVSSERNSFNRDFGVTTRRGENFGLSVLLRDGDEVYRTYFTSGRGVETLGTSWTFLDLAPFGRQETWEKSPRGWPQRPPYDWWRRHDEY